MKRKYWKPDEMCNNDVETLVFIVKSEVKNFLYFVVKMYLILFVHVWQIL